jgi:hypothetical protein
MNYFFLKMEMGLHIFCSLTHACAHVCVCESVCVCVHLRACCVWVCTCTCVCNAHAHRCVCMCMGVCAHVRGPCHNGNWWVMAWLTPLETTFVSLFSLKVHYYAHCHSHWGKQEEITCTLHIYRTSNQGLSTTQF